MVKKMFTRKSEEGVSETVSDLGCTRYAPKITIEEYTSASLNVECPLHISNGLTTDVSREKSKKQESGDSNSVQSFEPWTDSDSYAANIYCQVSQVSTQDETAK